MNIFEKIKEKYEMDKIAYEELDMSNVMSSVAIKANKTIVITAMVSLFTNIATLIYSIWAKDYWVNLLLLIIATINSVIAIVVGLTKKYEGTFTKYFLVSVTLLNAFLLSIYVSYVGCCMFVLGIVLTIQFFDIKLTIYTSIISEILYVLSILAYAWITYNSGYLFIRVLYAPLDSVVYSGANSIISVEGMNLSTYAGYLSSHFSVYFIMFSFIIFITAIISVRSAFLGGQMVIEESELRTAKSKVELENNETKTRIMISQIQPHFIYNTLNSIYYLCEKEPLTAQKALGEFSDYLRENLNLNSSNEVVPFNHELNHIKKYLSLEKMRFEDELNIEFDIKCSCFRVPSLSLQPLVENAVKHGVGKKKGGGTVRIISRETQEFYEVVISDDGVGFDVNKQFSSDRVHIGLENTRGRLERMIGATLNIDSQIGVGSTMTIKIPKENYYEDTSR